MRKYSKILKNIFSILFSMALAYNLYYQINKFYKRHQINKINKLNSEARIFSNLKCQIRNLEKTNNPNSKEYIDGVKLLNNELIKFENKLKSNYSDSSDIRFIYFTTTVITQKECPKK